MNMTCLSGRAAIELLAARPVLTSSKVIAAVRATVSGSINTLKDTIKFRPGPALYSTTIARHPRPRLCPCNLSLSLVFYGTKAGRVLSSNEAVFADQSAIGVQAVEPTDPELVAFSDHNPFGMKVGGDAMKQGTYTRSHGWQEKSQTGVVRRGGRRIARRVGRSRGLVCCRRLWRVSSVQIQSKRRSRLVDQVIMDEVLPRGSVLCLWVTTAINARFQTPDTQRKYSGCNTTQKRRVDDALGLCAATSSAALQSSAPLAPTTPAQPTAGCMARDCPRLRALGILS